MCFWYSEGDGQWKPFSYGVYCHNDVFDSHMTSTLLIVIAQINIQMLHILIMLI